MSSNPGDTGQTVGFLFECVYIYIYIYIYIHIYVAQARLMSENKSDMICLKADRCFKSV